MKGAWIDYWDKLDVTYYESYEDFLARNADGEMYYFSAHGKRSYAEIIYPENAYLIFGKESVGLPRELIEQNYENSVRIPMREGVRCLNLSNAAAVAVYEALRQQNFEGLA